MNSPPGLFLRFFRWFCDPHLRNPVEGDLMELYGERLASSGKSAADMRFIGDVLLLCRPGIVRSLGSSSTINNYTMFKNYFKITWRNLLRNKGYSVINISGLAIGMTVALLIGLWIRDEITFDSYFKNHDHLAQVMLNQSDKGIVYTGSTIAPPVADPLRQGFAGDIKATSLVSWNNNHILAVGDKKLMHPGSWVQQDFPDMFSLNVSNGNRNALKDPSTMLICHSLAKALFGDSDPLNRTVRIDNRFDMTIGGVFEDLPRNTTFADVTYLLPWDNKENWYNQATSWDNHCSQLFVQLADQVDVDVLSERVKSLPTSHIKGWKEEIMLHPMNKIHLYDEFEQAKATGGRIQFVWMYGIIGAFVLLLACINFMNLSTARSERRAKEVGIRKTIGSLRSQLIGQFLCESTVIAFLAFAFSLLFAQLTISPFNEIADKNISITWTNPWFWVLSLTFVLVTGILAGSYPAFYLSAFRPVKVLKGAFRGGRLASLPRKVLVVVQFTVSISLIIGTVIVFRQIQYAKQRLPGYSRDRLITVEMNTPAMNEHYDAIQNELLRTGAVEHMARSSQSPTNFDNNNGVDWRGKDPGLVIFFRNVTVTHEYGKTIGWTVKEGRDYSADFQADSSSVIFNEAAIKVMGFKNPLGEMITFGGKQYAIVGVVEDMVTGSPYEPIEPAIFVPDGWKGVMIIRLNSALPVREALATIEPVFRKQNPDGPFEYRFVDDDYARKFSAEERIGNLAGLFAILAIFISCLGLFGLASFVAEQRTKEIGIRKVLGASVINLWRMLSREFVILVSLSCAIAIPVSVLFISNWLQHYNYRTTITWPILAAAGLGALGITLLTVSFQAIRAAVANPVTSLRSE